MTETHRERQGNIDRENKTESGGKENIVEIQSEVFKHLQ